MVSSRSLELPSTLALYFCKTHVPAIKKNIMENNPTNDTILNLSIDEAATSHLKKAAYWAKIIAIAGFIGLVLGLVQQIKGSSRARVSVGSGAAAISQMTTYVFLGIIYVVMIFLYLYLLRFADSTNTGLTTFEQEKFNSGIGNLRSFFKLLGIVLIIVLSICVLILLFAVLGAAVNKH
jgi:hypothetical protein